MGRDIAFRRHQRKRMEARAKHVIRCVWGSPWMPAYKYADNLTKCSCEMCQPGGSGRQVKRADAKEAWERKRLEGD